VTATTRRSPDAAGTAVVVGAGPNGLTAAARLARAGWRVVVFERAATVGGSTRTAELLVPGVRHDLGAAVVPFAAASPAFAALGLDLPLAHPDVALAHPLDGGRAIALHREIDATAAQFGIRAGRYRRLAEPLVRRFDALVATALGPVLRVPRHPLVLARHGPLLLGPGTLLARLVGDAGAAALIAGLASHATVPADRPLTGGVALTLLASGHAVGWPVVTGGTQVIAERLAADVLAHGGEIVVDHEVRSLAELPAARITLLDVTPRQLRAIAPGVSPAYRRWRYGPGACKVDYVLSGPVPWEAEACRRAATVHLGGTAAEILRAEQAVAAGRLADRPYVLAVQPHVADPSRAQGGLVPLWTYSHVPNGCDLDASDGMERQLDRFAPGWRDLVVAKRVLTAAASETANPNLIGGDIAGGLMTVRQMLLGARPGRSPYATDLPGVYLCSSSTPPGAGAHGMCGWHAAGAALRTAGRPVASAP
jgi:phytoene dehydrogenase-like protein